MYQVSFPLNEDAGKIVTVTNSENVKCVYLRAYSTVQYSTLQYSTVQYSTQQNFMEICPVRDELFHADRQKDGQT